MSKESPPHPVDGETAIVCADDHNGHRILFGYAKSWDRNSGVVLRRARCCVYYSRATKGEIGLGIYGPQEGSRVTDAIEDLELFATPERPLAYVMRCTPKAVQQWESGPWEL